MQKYIFTKDLWLKFGCFLTGYNYGILSECSEASKKYIKKITSALIIVISIWSMVGYMFASRYAGASDFVSLLSALIAGVIIVQIERQIILGENTRSFTLFTRVLLGVIVAIIGALILDQVFFKNDIAKSKEDLLLRRLEERVKDVQSRAAENISANMHKIDSLRKKIDENNIIAAKVGYKIQISSSERISGGDINKSNPNSVGQSSAPTIDRSKTYDTHPKILENKELRNQISIYEAYNKNENDSLFYRIERTKIAARNEPPGFLDELTIIVELATQSWIAFIAYMTFFSFFILIEMFIVLAKRSDGNNDYHRLIKYQEKIREERLMILEKKRTSLIGENVKIETSEELINQRPK